MIQAKVPERHPAAQQHVDLNNMRKIQEILFLGIPEYAGDRENPREVPQFTFYDYRTRYNDYLDTNIDLVNKTDVSFLNFYSNQFEADYRHGAIVSNEILWWLLRQGDSVLLSDGDVDHYTVIASKNHEKEQVSFMDRWPERFFLHGKNALGITAVDNLTITKEDFNQVIVGLISLDSTSLLYSIYNTFPALSTDLDYNLSAGIMVLDLKRDNLAFQAIPFLELALKLAKQKNSELEIMAASQLYYASLVTHFDYLCHGVKTTGELAQSLRKLEEDYESEQLLEELNDYELGRLGNISAWAQQFDAALEFLSKAIQKDSTREMPFLVRGKVYLRKTQFPESQADLNTSLTLVDKRIEELKHKLKQYDPEARDQIEYDSSLVAGMVNIKYEILHNLVTAYTATDVSKAIEIAKEMPVLKPEEPFAYELLAQLFTIKQDWENALVNINKALSYEKGEEQQNTLKKLKEDLIEKTEFS